MAPLKNLLITLFAALAVSVKAQYTSQSDPFNLYICSDNATYNGAGLFACHEGAAIEGLCVTQGGTTIEEGGSPTASPFYLNYSSFSGPDLGWLTFNLPVGGKFRLSSLPNDSQSLCISILFLELHRHR